MNRDNIITPRAKTAEEVCEEYLAAIRETVHFWAKLPDRTAEDRTLGVAFSILNILDGTTELPPVLLVLNVHPDEKKFCRSRGENWYKDGMVVNGGEEGLHDLLFEENLITDLEESKG